MGLLVMTFHLNMAFLLNLNIHSSTLNQVKVLCSERKSSKGWKLKGKAIAIIDKDTHHRGRKERQGWPELPAGARPVCARWPPRTSSRRGRAAAGRTWDCKYFLLRRKYFSMSVSARLPRV